MKNPKKFIGAVTSLMLLFCMYSFGYTTSTPSASDKIILTGDAHNPGPPRVPAAPSLEAYLDLDVITICFLNDLGNVTITITDEWGAVVQQTIEPSVNGAIAVLDISGLEPGVYTITFTNSSGLYLQGEFQI